MKNKIFNFILLLCLIIPSMFMFAACDTSDSTENALQNSLNKLTQEIGNLNDKITELESSGNSDNQLLLNKIKELNDEITRLKNSNATDKQSLVNKIDNLNNKILELTNINNSNKQEYTQQIEDLNTLINTLKTSINEDQQTLTEAIESLNNKITELENQIIENEQAIEENAMIDTAWALYSQARTDFFFNNNGVRNNLKIECITEFMTWSYNYYLDENVGYLYMRDSYEDDSRDDPYTEEKIIYEKDDILYEYFNAYETDPENPWTHKYSYGYSSDIEAFINLDYDYIFIIDGDEPACSYSALTKSNITSVTKTDNGYKIKFVLYEKTENDILMITLEKEVSFEAKMLNETVIFQNVNKYTQEIDTGETIIEITEGDFDRASASIIYNYGGVDTEKILEVYNQAINYVENENQ